VTTGLSGRTAVVTGASRGFGRGVAGALVAAGVDVVGIARGVGDLQATASDLGKGFTPVVADAADGSIAGDMIAAYRPSVLVLNAGAIPPMAPIHEQTWASFSRNWEVDARQAFDWLGAALRAPLSPGSVVVAVSSGAALRGSPLSGGYAAAKSAVRFVASYAAGEAERLGLGLRVVSLFPQLSPLTGVGAAGAEAYAERADGGPDAYRRSLGALLTPAAVGDAVLEAVRAALGEPGGPAYAEFLLTPAGVRPLTGER
jgi:NAD(P)-dependent dehydrogenase (short-subunit alcohol dehydrogenase family)